MRRPPPLRWLFAVLLAAFAVRVAPADEPADEPAAEDPPAAISEEEADRREDIEVNTAKGWKAFRSGNHDECVLRMERLAKLDPANPLPDYLRARVEARTGKYEEALARLATAVAAHPDDRRLSSFRYQLLLELSRFGQAEAEARAAADAHPDDVVARAALGLALEQRGKRDEALSEVTKVVDAAQAASTDANVLPWVARAALSATRLDPDPAVDYVQQVLNLLATYLKSHPEDQDVWLVHADTWQRDRGVRAQAIAQKEYERQLLKENSEVAEARVGYARYFLIFYQQDKAIKQLERALVTNPKLVPALTLLASIRVGDGDYDKAQELLDRALKVSPKDKEARAVLAAKHRIMGKADESAAVEKEVLADDPTYGRLYVIASELVGERQRRFDRARDLAKKAIEVDPSEAYAYVVLGENLMNLGLTDEAEVQFKLSVEKSKKHEDVHRDNWIEILRHLKGFQVRETEHFRVRMHLREVQVLEPYLLPLLEEAWKTLSAKYGFAPQGPIHVDTFHIADDFSVRSIGTPGLPALGVCFGKVITLLGPTAGRLGSFSWSRTAWHEFAHVVTLQLSEGQVPRWLTEGLSVYEEQARRSIWGRDMQQQLYDRWKNGRLLKMAEINSAFMGPDILFAYYQGGLIAEHLEGFKGFSVVPEMLKRFANDETTKNVFQTVLGIKLEEYDQLFSTFVGKIVADYRMVPNWDDASVEGFETKVKEDPRDADSWTKLGWARIERGKTIDAGDALQKAVTLTPEAPDVVLLQGRLAEVGGRPDLAETHYRKFLSLGGDDLKARLFLAQRTLADGKDTKQAVEHLEAAKRCFPYHVGKDSPYLTLAKLHEAAGDGDAALAEYEAFARIAPENYGVRKEKLAPTYRRKHDLAGLVRVCEEMVDISPFGANASDPPDLQLHRDYRDALAELGRGDEALREARVQVLLVSGLPEDERVGAGEVKDRLRYGTLLLEAGKIEDAIEQANGIERLSPKDAGAAMLRQRAQEAGGR